jgi:hypothetical protein
MAPNDPLGYCWPETPFGVGTEMKWIDCARRWGRLLTVAVPAMIAGRCASPPPPPPSCAIVTSEAVEQQLLANNTETQSLATPQDCSLYFKTSNTDYDYIVPYPRAQVVVPPLHGKASAAKTTAGVTISYAPAAGFTGSDQFTLRVQPGDILMRVTVQVPP